MKYIGVLLFVVLSAFPGLSQTGVLDGFLDGKSAVLISASPAGKPVLSWMDLAEDLHGALVAAGGDPVSYHELEDIVISEGTQAAYAASFSQRLIKNVVVITRKDNAELVIHIMPFSQDKTMVSPGSAWSASANNLEEFKERITAIGQNRKSNNFLVLEVPEFASGNTAAQIQQSSEAFLPRNPLNLDVFKLGVRLSGAGTEAGFLTTFRYDLLGKSQEQIMAEQQRERSGLESVFKENYPYQVEFLTEPRTDEALIKDRVQFVLMRMEGREGDLMERMGLEVNESLDTQRFVIKYYIKFLVRNELYIGPLWDADPDWNTALTDFLRNLQK
ncbi:MAG TPA: hypothetical protein VKX33_03320 [Cyclobacteriaceae bacterium]|nr:hypothetical protein [Cyclobacteriaceae bacterium]